jgi:hypothetical protein
MTNNNDEEMSEEDVLKASEAYLTFVNRFGEYIKEMDPKLWEKAREYAADFTKIPGVTVELVDNDNDDEDEDDRDSSKRASD